MSGTRRVCKIWANCANKKKEDPHNPLDVPYREPAPNGTNGTASDLHLKAAKKFPTLKQQQIWVAQQEIKAAETRANARADELKRVMLVIKQGQQKAARAQKEKVGANLRLDISIA